MPAKWGSFLLRHLMAGGYDLTSIFPVNPHEEKIHGLKAYPDLASIPKKVDLVIITTPAKLVAGILDQVAACGIRHVVVISSSFSEVGVEGEALERELAEKARTHGLNMVGPNTMGVINTACDMFAVGAPLQLTKGNISYVSQSGNVGAQMLGWTMSQGIGFGKFVGSGNEATLHCEDYLEYFGEDDDTNLILAYIEGLENGRRFMETAGRVCRRKPVIALKSGRTEAGMRAAASHTGALAGSDTIY
ncbi:MAG: CoA-binding protein, partial [Candidatus Geothermincolia bacterium]